MPGVVSICAASGTDIGDENIDAAEFFSHALDPRLVGFLVGDVNDGTSDLYTLGAKIRYRRIDFFLIARADPQIDAFVSQLVGNGSANTASGASDDCIFSR